MKDYIYIKSKGFFYYVEGDSALIVSYLLNRECNSIIYIERTKINGLISTLNECHINYYFKDLNKFTDNKYSNYLEYGKVYLKINKLTKKLKELIYVENISFIIDEMDSLL